MCDHVCVESCIVFVEDFSKFCNLIKIVLIICIMT